MNYHSDEWIMNGVKEHYEEACEYYPQERILGIFLVGSQNYGLDTENSDIDTKVIVIPSVGDFIYNAKPISTTHIRENNEHIDFKDIRLIFNELRKGSINCIEMLFTPYFILNKRYEYLWNKLIAEREKIATCNPLACIRASKGIFDRNSKLLFKVKEEHEKVKWGYNPKALYHVLRLSWFITDFLEGNKTYEECLRNRSIYQDQTLHSARTERWSLNAVTSYSFAQECLVEMRINTFINNYNDKDKAEDIKAVKELLDFIQYYIIENSIKEELA